MPNLIINSRHPRFLSETLEWERWRLCYEAGECFVDNYLELFSNREDKADFAIRKRVTPIPGFSAAAVNDVRNSIFQRLVDVSRTGGSEAYQKAIHGEGGGVDRRGSTMNAFLGTRVLTELCVMGRVGVYVDSPVITQMDTLADIVGKRPYLYSYPIEDILSWACVRPDEPAEFRSVMLRDRCESFDQITGLPIGEEERFRLLWLDEITGKVMLQFYDLKGNQTDRDGNSAGPVQLDLDRIPFVMVDIGDSLIRQVCRHQIALLNLTSSDVSYALRSSFPFYTEQRDIRGAGSHLKTAQADGTATTGGQGADTREISVGPMHGRAYDMKAERPGFIHPSAEPLKASLELQEKLKREIRELVNLAIKNLGGRQSGSAKEVDNEGLSAGLSHIGLNLENGERKVAEHWAAYEERVVVKRKVAVIKYPDRYSLKTDDDRINEAEKLGKLLYSIPSRQAKRTIAKRIVSTLLSGRESVETVQSIHTEIDNAPYVTSDPKTIEMATERGLAGEKTASIALGFDEDEHLKARADHAERVKRIAESQSSNNPAARGVTDMSGDPKRETAAEKEGSRETATEESNESRVRGEGDE